MKAFLHHPKQGRVMFLQEIAGQIHTWPALASGIIPRMPIALVRQLRRVTSALGL